MADEEVVDALDRSWPTDWSSFVNELVSLVRANAGLNQTFAGHTVVWAGEIYETLLLARRPRVILLMPRRSFEQDGHEYVLSHVSIPIESGSADEWRHYEPGTEVTFSAVFDDVDAMVPPVRLVVLPNGRTVVNLQLRHARPIARLDSDED